MEATRRWLAGAGGEIRIGEERCGGLVAGSGSARAVAGGGEGPVSGLRLLIVFMVRGPQVSPYVLADATD